MYNTRKVTTFIAHNAIVFHQNPSTGSYKFYLSAIAQSFGPIIPTQVPIVLTLRIILEFVGGLKHPANFSLISYVVIRTVRSICLGCRPGRTAGGPPLFESMHTWVD